jgi:hypothetical protein
MDSRNSYSLSTVYRDILKLHAPCICSPKSSLSIVLCILYVDKSGDCSPVTQDFHLFFYSIVVPPGNRHERHIPVQYTEQYSANISMLEDSAENLLTIQFRRWHKWHKRSLHPPSHLLGGRKEQLSGQNKVRSEAKLPAAKL